MEKNIIQRFEKIDEIGSERMRAIFPQVPALRLPDLLYAIRHVRIKRRYQPRLELDAQLLQVLRIGLEERLRQRPDPDQLQVSFQPIGQHGQLVDPGLAEKAAPGSDPEIIFDLAAVLELVLVENILVQVFGKRVHGAQFVYVEDPAVPAQPALAEDRAVRGLGVSPRFFGLFGDEIKNIVDRPQADDLETAVIEAAQHLGPRENPSLAAGDPEVDFLQQRQLGHDALVKEIDPVEYPAEPARELAEYPGLALVERLEAAHEDAAIFQLRVGGDEHLVHAAKIVRPLEIEEKSQGVVLHDPDVVRAAGEHQGGAQDIEAAEVHVLADEFVHLPVLAEKQSLELPAQDPQLILGLLVAVPACRRRLERFPGRCLRRRLAFVGQLVGQQLRRVFLGAEELGVEVVDRDNHVFQHYKGGDGSEDDHARH